MSSNIWLAFALSTLLICLTPGPNMLCMLALGLRHGVRATVPAMLGALLVLLVLLVASALGLGLVLQQSARAFLLLKVAGAAYLAFLGLRLLRAEPTQVATVSVPVSPARQPLPALAALCQGMAVAASNPKALLFAVAWFPQFLDPGRSAWSQLAVALPTFLVLETVCYVLYAASGEGLARRLTDPRTARWLSVAVGVLFLVFAALLLWG